MTRPATAPTPPLSGNGDPVGLVLSRVKDAKPAGRDKWLAYCPVHENDGGRHTPSLSITRGDDGRALVYCQANCAFKDVVAAMGLEPRDLFTPGTAPARAPRGTARPKGKGKPPPRTYATLDEAQAAALAQVQGQAKEDDLDPAGVTFSERWQYRPDFFIVRFNLPTIDPETNKPQKTFRPLSRTAAGWSVADPPGKLPLYRGDTVPPTGRIFIFEGERCADRAASFGVTAVTSAHGAKAAQNTDWGQTAGHECVICQRRREDVRIPPV